MNHEIESDMRAMVIASLTNFGLQPDPAESFENLFLQLLQFRRRTVPTSKRRIVEAEGFDCPPEVLDGYSLFKGKVNQGADLLPYLSIQIENLRTRDQLLNDWGVHHFHMGISRKTNKPDFVERTGPVLLAVVKPDTLYAIGFWHHEFASKEVLEIMHKNWPNLMGEPMKGVVGIENPNKTAEEISALRKAGIITSSQIGNQVFFSPGGGYSSTGDNIQDVTELNLSLIHI